MSSTVSWRAALCTIVAVAGVTAARGAHAQVLTSRASAEGARIAGRVIDAATGRAVPRAAVHLEGLQSPPAPVGTDEEGIFAFTDVPPCSCVLTVDKAGFLSSRHPDAPPTLRRSARSLIVGAGSVFDDLVIPLYRGGSISGRIVDAFGDPVESATVQVLRAGAANQRHPGDDAETDDRGEFRVAKLQPGRYLLFVAHRNRADDPNDSQPVPTFFPGVLEAAQALPLTVERGQSVTGIDFALLSGTTAWVSGVLLDENGARIQSTGVTTTARRLGGGTVDYGQFPVDVTADGGFRVSLPPGDYQIEARMTPRTAPLQPGLSLDRVGVLSVTVSGTPVSDLALQLGPGATMSGRVVFEGAGAQPDRGRGTEVLVASFTAPPGSQCWRGATPATRGRRGAVETDRDWTFRLPGLFGTCILSLSTRNLEPWSVAAVYSGDADLLDRPVSFDAGQDLRDVRVVLSDRRTQLDLLVSDENGVSVRDYVALVFAVDPARWHATSRFVRTFQPTTRPTAPPQPSAVFGASRASADRINELPRGDYFAIALDDMPFDAPRDPATLAQLLKAATRVTVAAGTENSVALQRLSFDDVMKR